MSTKKKPSQEAREYLKEKVADVRCKSERLHELITNISKQPLARAEEVLKEKSKKSFLAKFSNASQELQACLNQLLIVSDAISSLGSSDDENEESSESDDDSGAESILSVTTNYSSVTLERQNSPETLQPYCSRENLVSSLAGNENLDSKCTCEVPSICSQVPPTGSSTEQFIDRVSLKKSGNRVESLPILSDVVVEPFKWVVDVAYPVVVTNIVTPMHFYVQLVNREIDLMEELYIQFIKDSSIGYHGGISYVPPVNSFCCAKSTLDGNWYRAKIVAICKHPKDELNDSILEDVLVKVFFIDEGYENAVNLASIRPLEAKCALIPSQSFQCILGGIQPIEAAAVSKNLSYDDCNKMWSASSNSYFDKLVHTKELVTAYFYYPPSVAYQPPHNISRETLVCDLYLVNSDTKVAWWKASFEKLCLKENIAFKMVVDNIACLHSFFNSELNRKKSHRTLEQYISAKSYDGRVAETETVGNPQPSKEVKQMDREKRYSGEVLIKREEGNISWLHSPEEKRKLDGYITKCEKKRATSEYVGVEPRKDSDELRHKDVIGEPLNTLCLQKENHSPSFESKDELFPITSRGCDDEIKSVSTRDFSESEINCRNTNHKSMSYNANIYLDGNRLEKATEESFKQTSNPIFNRDLKIFDKSVNNTYEDLLTNDNHGNVQGAEMDKSLSENIRSGDRKNVESMNIPESLQTSLCTTEESSECGSFKFVSTFKETLLTVPESDKYVRVMISEVINPGLFYLHLITSDSILLDSLMEQMNLYYDEMEGSIRTYSQEITLTMGTAVSARFPNDMKWYRAVVISNEFTNKCNVSFVDYGGSDWVSVEHILPMVEEFADLPMACIACCLADIKPKFSEKQIGDACLLEDTVTNWPEKAILRSKELMLTQLPMMISLKDSLKNSDGLYEVYLHDTTNDKDVFINQRLVQEGLAVFCEVPPIVEEELEESEGEAMSKWDPMLDQFSSNRNVYSIDIDDPGIATVGIVESKTNVCNNFIYRGYCYRGDDCKFAHVKPGDPLLDSVEVFCWDNLLTLPEVNQCVPIVIRAFIDPTHFWVNFPYGIYESGFENESECDDCGDTALEKLHSEMELYYSKLGHSRKFNLSLLAEGELIAARYHEDFRWYRARVINSGDDFVQVSFVDYGNTDIVSVDDTNALLSHFLVLPFQAVECFLYNTYLRQNLTEEGELFCDMRLKFREMVADKVLMAHIVSNSMNKIDVMMYDTSVQPHVYINEVIRSWDGIEHGDNRFDLCVASAE